LSIYGEKKKHTQSVPSPIPLVCRHSIPVIARRSTSSIETPKGSRNKYAFDPERGVFALKKVLPVGMTFPHEFGFVPSTKPRMAIRLTFWCSWTNRRFPDACSSAV